MKFPGFMATFRFCPLTFCLAGALVLTACSKSSPSASPIAGKGKDYWLDWNMKTLVGAYEKSGHKNPAWDPAAKRGLAEFARSRARAVGTNEDSGSIISVSIDSATRAGCDDPLIHYLYIKFVMDQTNGREAFSTEFCNTARQLDVSDYPEIRKFYAAERALDQLYYTYGTNIGTQPDAPIMANLAEQHLTAVLGDKNMPAEEAYEASTAAIDPYNHGENWVMQKYGVVEPLIFTNWPNAATTWLLKGETYIRLAWLARGGGYANEVNQQAFQTFFDRLSTAENALSNAWRLDPTDGRIPTAMISVDEGLQHKRDEMETWFARAMACNPNNFEACSHKLHYLYPQWYGSREDMVNFGRECVAATNWGGKVPLVLVDAHSEYQRFLPDEETKEEYWKHSDVWPDIKAAYERYFTLYPADTALYNNYAWYAYHCGQWDAFLALVQKMDPVNYGFFGGQTEFDQMVANAKAQTSAK